MISLEPWRPDSGLLVWGSRPSHRLKVNNSHKLQVINSHRFQANNQSSRTFCRYIRSTIDSWLKTDAGLLQYRILKKLCLLPDLGSVSFYRKVDPTKSGAVSKAAYRLRQRGPTSQVGLGKVSKQTKKYNIK